MNFRQKIWRLRSGFYRIGRSLPVFSAIHQKELEGLKTLLSSIPDDIQTLLDIGFGSGGSLAVFPESWTIFGLDWSPAMMKRANAESHHIYRIAGDAQALPIKPRSFSLVSVIGLLEYVEDKSAFLSELSLILKPDGYALLTIAPSNPFNRLRIILGHRLFFISTQEWERLLANEWHIVKCRSTLLQGQVLIQRI